MNLLQLDNLIMMQVFIVMFRDRTQIADASKANSHPIILANRPNRNIANFNEIVIFNKGNLKSIKGNTL